MLDWLIDLLEGARAAGAFGEVQLIAIFAAVVVAPLVAVFAGTRAIAKRRYRRDIEQMSDLRHQLANRQDDIDRLRKEKERLAADCERLSAEGPGAFLDRIAREERDGNLEPAVKAARAFHARHREALHRAYGLLTDAAIIEASEDGASGYANALLYARGGLAADPADEHLRDLEAELEQAAVDPDSDVRRAPASGADRAARRAAREALPTDLAALQACWTRAYETGRWRLMRRYAEYGLRLAERGEAGETQTVLLWRSHLANAERFNGRPRRALDLLEPDRKPWNAVFGPDDPVSLAFRFSIADCLLNTGAAGEALEDARALLTDQERVQGADHPDTLATRSLIPDCLLKTGAAGEALEDARALLKDEKRVQGADHPGTLTTRFLIADCLRRTGAAGEALEVARALLTDRERVQGADHPHTLATRYLIADCLLNTGAAGEALEDARALLTDRERVQGADHPDTLTTRFLIADCLRRTGAAGAALEDARALLTDQERVQGADHPHTLTTRSLIAACLLNTGAAGEALEDARVLLTDQERVKGADHPDTLATRSFIARLLLDLGDVDSAGAVHDGVVAALRNRGLLDGEDRLEEALTVDRRLEAASDRAAD